MDRWTTVCVSLLYVWCSLNAGGLLMNVNGMYMSTSILRPGFDSIKEGGKVEMKCAANNIDKYPDYVVEWTTLNPLQTLRVGYVTAAGVTSRYTFQTGSTGWVIIEYFNITDLHRNDSNVYVCNVYGKSEDGQSTLVATSSVMLSVLYFPSESFPICYPDGPITVDIGTELYMLCSSEAGNSAVMLDVFQLQKSKGSQYSYTWTPPNINDDTISKSLNLTVDVVDDNATFYCVISSMQFPNMNRSCDIGPISVRAVTEAPTKTTIKPTTEPMTTPPVPPSNTALIAGASAGGAAALVLILILILICRRRHLKQKPQKPDINLKHTAFADPKVSDKTHSKTNSTDTPPKPMATVSPVPRKPKPYKSYVHHTRNAHDEVDQQQNNQTSSQPEPTPPSTQPDFVSVPVGVVDGGTDEALPHPSQTPSTHPDTSVPLEGGPVAGGNDAEPQSPPAAPTHPSSVSVPLRVGPNADGNVVTPQPTSTAPIHPVSQPVPQDAGGNNATPQLTPPPPTSSLDSFPVPQNRGPGGVDNDAKHQPTPRNLQTETTHVLPDGTDNGLAGDDTPSPHTDESAPHVPSRKPTRTEQHKPPGDQIIYADLNLQSGSSEDGGQVISTEEPTTYASITF